MSVKKKADEVLETINSEEDTGPPSGTYEIFVSESARSDYGIIIFCDIVAFSEKVQAEQIHCLQFLSHLLQQVATDLQRKERVSFRIGKNYINCTGDGFVMAISFSDTINGERASLELCVEILRRLEEYEPHPESVDEDDESASEDEPAQNAHLKMRFGIHCGNYRFPVRVFGTKHAIGLAVNHAARVGAIGDASQIVVSEEFYDLGEPEKKKAWRDRFSERIDVAVKHDRLAKVRLYEGTPKEKKFLNREIPRRIALLEQADEKIKKILEAINGALVATFVDEENVNTETALGARLSVFIPDRKGERLKCSRYRSITKGRYPRDASPNKTAYYLNPPFGPLARAFADKQAVFELDLPDPEDFGSYIAEWERRSKEQGVVMDRKHMEKWGYYPRAIIGVPFHADEKHHYVLCIDTKHPLNHFSGKAKLELEEFIEQLRTDVLNDRLAWNLRLRKTL